MPSWQRTKLRSRSRNRHRPAMSFADQLRPAIAGLKAAGFTLMSLEEVEVMVRRAA